MRCRTNHYAASILAVFMLLALLSVSGCTEIRTMNLTAEYANATAENATSGAGQPSGGASNISEDTGIASNTTLSEENLTGEDVPVVVDKGASVYVDPDNLVKNLCPEQVLLGLRGCRRVDGSLNISIRNSGYRNVTMIFYLLYDSQEAGSVYFDETFYSKTEKTYTIDLESLEEEHGQIEKIQATPVLVQGMEAVSCQNKKLPIMVSSGCH